MKNTRALLIGIDGAGLVIGTQYTPNINKIMENGSKANRVLTGNPTTSAECWGTLFTGTIPSLLQFTNTSITNNKNNVSDKYPTFFKKIREKFKESNIVSFCHWKPINNGIIEDDIGVIKVNISDDVKLKEKVVNYINSNDFKMMYIHFDSVDGEGHTTGYNKEKYYNQLSIVDTYVLDIYNILKKNSLIENTLLIVTSDHGGILTDHGGFSYKERFVYLGVTGPGIKKGIMSDAYIRDIPSIIAKFFDIELGESFDSYLPSNLFINELNPKSRNEIFKNIPKKTINLEDVKKSFDFFNNLKVYINMDNNIKNLVGENKINYIGNIQYSEGFYSKGLNISKEGYLTINDYKLNNNNDFSFSMIIKIINISEDFSIFSNKNWNYKNKDGIAIILKENNLQVNCGYKDINTNDIFFHYPVNNKDFFNLIVTFDSKKKLISSYINHSLEYILKLNNDFNLDGEYPIIIGQKTEENSNSNFECIINDLMIFDKVLSNKEILKMKEIYMDL